MFNRLKKPQGKIVPVMPIIVETTHEEIAERLQKKRTMNLVIEIPKKEEEKSATVKLPEEKQLTRTPKL